MGTVPAPRTRTRPYPRSGGCDGSHRRAVGLSEHEERSWATASKPGGWAVERLRGPTSDLLAAPWPGSPKRIVRFLEPTRPALVLGSTQADEVVDRVRADVSGIDVVRRTSGGGAVLVEANSMLWVEMMVPADDELWQSDVGRAAWWLGRAWERALTALGFDDVRVHEGGIVASAWSTRVCFAGLGPGEVTIGQRKVVGISQRRTRSAARFQCAALLTWDPTAVVNLLAFDGGDVERADATAAIEPIAMGLTVGSAELVPALLETLPGSSDRA